MIYMIYGISSLKNLSVLFALKSQKPLRFINVQINIFIAIFVIPSWTDVLFVAFQSEETIQVIEAYLQKKYTNRFLKLASIRNVR